MQANEQATANLPSPLVPIDCDLSGLDSTMLDHRRLRGSRLALVAKKKPVVAWVNVLLWGAAWEESTPASLENDDDVLADRAMRTTADWAAIRGEVLAWWTLCNNNRWYHPVVAEKANELWAGRLRKRHELCCARERKAWKAAEKPGEPPKVPLMTWVKENFPQSYAARHVLFPKESKGESDAGDSDGEDRERNQNTVTAPVTDAVTEPVAASVTEPVTAQSQPFNVKVKVKEKVKVNSTVEDKSSTGAAGAVVVPFPVPDRPDWWPQRDSYGRVVMPAHVPADKLLYDVGRVVLGREAGGVITRLKRCSPYRRDFRAAVELLLTAHEEKSDPKAWFMAALGRAEMNDPIRPNHEVYPESVYRA